MRFLMLNWRDPENPLSGGAERVTQGYLAALAKRGHEVHWFAYDFPGAAPEAVIDGIRIHRAGGKSSAFRAARKWCQSQPKFDLVMDQHHGIPWYAPWWCGTNCVAYIHEVLGPIWDAFYRWPLNVVGKQQERWTHWAYRNVPFWTACESTRDCLHANGVKRVNIIRYGVHTVALPELPAKNLPSANEPLKLAMVSRLAPNKRIDHGIETLRALLARKIPATLQVVGTGEELDRLQVAATGIPAGALEFTGPMKEAAKDALLRDAHWLLHTSQREGWGLNVIEANAMGTPAAVYPVAGLRESTLDNRTGLVSADETPEALAARIVDLLKAPEQYQRLRAQAWERAKKFHWSQILPGACDWLEAHARGERPMAVAEE